MENQEMEIETESKTVKKFCKDCREDKIFVETESPGESLICSSCGIRESIKNKRLIFDGYGYRFEEI